MVILSDCLTQRADEGCLKIANSLARQMKKRCPHTFVISYGCQPNWSDMHLRLNKLFWNPSFLSFLRHRGEPVLYIPFASNTLASILRILVLSVFTGDPVWVIFALRHPMNRLSKRLLKWSHARIIALSKESYHFYSEIVGNQAVYLKAGVDIQKFTPASAEKVQQLRLKYHVRPGKKVVLHVGHLKTGRNIEVLAELGDAFQPFLVVSSVTEQDAQLRKQLEEQHVTIIDEYIEHIEELYQMADIYLFPVLASENCIDVPLSVFEAAACNTPIIATAYGENIILKNTPGAIILKEINEDTVRSAAAALGTTCCTRSAVLEYDWNQSIEKLTKLIDEEL